MKDVLKSLLEPIRGNLLKTCLAREYLQARILQAMQDEGIFRSWAFVGGTALRFLYSIPRFSEDLDFSLIEKGKESRFAEAMRRIESAFRKEAYAVSIAAKGEKTVASAFVKFAGLPYEIGLSAQRSQVFSIKIELDTSPPAGAGFQTTLVRRHVTLNLVHYDKASLLAGKMHALLTRKYTKGRDLYDLVWYLADRTWPSPNLVLLNAALTQTGWSGPIATPDNWRSLLIGRMDHFAWDTVRADVQPFLERPDDADLITRENVMSLLENR
jgi:predicted nucleotidyltransferase component of viral defense system